jgi:hypothetical protein
MYNKRFSASAIEGFITCPMSFFIQRICGVYEDQSIYATRGDFVHRCCKGLLTRACGKSKGNIKLYKQILEDELFAVYNDICRKFFCQLSNDEMINLKQKFEVAMGSKFVMHMPLEIESQFFIAVHREKDEAKIVNVYQMMANNEEYYYFTGFLDFVYEEDDKIVVGDWKAGKLKSPRVLQTGWQYKIYSLYAIMKYPEKTYGEMVFCFLTEDKVKPVTLFFSNALQDQLIHELRLQAKQISNCKVFRCKKNYLCANYCDFLHVCKDIEYQLLHSNKQSRYMFKKLNLYINRLLGRQLLPTESR